MRCLYVDLDGTLLGPGGSLLRGGDGGFSLLGARALEACAPAGVEGGLYSGRRGAGGFARPGAGALEACPRAGVGVVLYGGRGRSSVFDAPRLIGASAYV